MNEYLGMVVSMHGTHAVCRDLVTGHYWMADAGYCDIGAFVYADGTPRVVTGETLPRPELWEAAAERAAACVDGDWTLLPRLMAEREKAIRGQRRAIDAGKALVTVDGGLLRVRMTTGPDDTDTHYGSARFKLDEAGCAVRLDGVPMPGPDIVLFSHHKPKPRDPATTCSCGATKARHERVCGACFGGERRGVDPFAHADPDRWPGQEQVTSVRCPKCRSKCVLALVRATYDVWWMADAGPLDADSIEPPEGLPDVSLARLQCNGCHHEWTPPEHLHHNWVRR